MGELVLLKLGGSLLTDKTRPQSIRADVLRRLAAEVARARAERPELRLVIGHGSGSFGHVVGNKYGTRRGVASPEEWRGYAETAHIAARLNRLVMDALWAAGIPALPIQPSASAVTRGGVLQSMVTHPLEVALAKGLVPVVYGDVALDEVQGGTIISTEEIFAWLAPRLAAQRVLLLGEVEGVFSADPAAPETGRLIEEITPDMMPDLAQRLGGSRGIDVTGGMLTKVQAMVALVQAVPSLTGVQLFSGLITGLLHAALTQPGYRVGTRVHAK